MGFLCLEAKHRLAISIFSFKHLGRNELVVCKINFYELYESAEMQIIIKRNVGHGGSRFSRPSSQKLPGHSRCTQGQVGSEIPPVSPGPRCTCTKHL